MDENFQGHHSMPLTLTCTVEIKHDYVRKQDDRAWFISKDDEDKPDM